MRVICSKLIIIIIAIIIKENLNVRNVIDKGIVIVWGREGKVNLVTLDLSWKKMNSLKRRNYYQLKWFLKKKNMNTCINFVKLLNRKKERKKQ